MLTLDFGSFCTEVFILMYQLFLLIILLTANVWVFFPHQQPNLQLSEYQIGVPQFKSILILITWI